MTNRIDHTSTSRLVCVMHLVVVFAGPSCGLGGAGAASASPLPSVVDTTSGTGVATDGKERGVLSLSSHDTLFIGLVSLILFLLLLFFLWYLLWHASLSSIPVIRHIAGLEAKPRRRRSLTSKRGRGNGSKNS